MIESGTATSESLFKRGLRHIPGGSARSTLFVPPNPRYLERGSGYAVWDVEGAELIDLQANMTALVHGHAHPEIVRAATEAIESGSCFGQPGVAEIEFAELLASRMAGAPSWRFVNSGTEAVTMAIRAARAYTGRRLVLRCRGAYHGGYDAVLAPDSPGVDSVPASVEVEFNDVAGLAETFERLGPQIACAIVDLMPSRIGMPSMSDEFASCLRRGARECGALVIADEVITFRLATGGLQQLRGFEPDLTTLAKVVGGGYPFGALGGRRKVMDVFDHRRAGHVPLAGTLSANPVSLGAGMAAVRLLDQNVVGRINGLGDRLRESLKSLGYQVNGRGSLLQIVTSDAPELWRRAYEAGLLLCSNGLISVSTPMDDSVIDEVIQRFEGLGVR